MSLRMRPTVLRVDHCCLPLPEDRPDSVIIVDGPHEPLRQDYGETRLRYALLHDRIGRALVTDDPAGVLLHPKPTGRGWRRLRNWWRLRWATLSPDWRHDGQQLRIVAAMRVPTHPNNNRQPPHRKPRQGPTCPQN
jgi:hypothetical protein